VINPELLDLARRELAENPPPPLTEEQKRGIVALFGPLNVPRKTQRLAA